MLLENEINNRAADNIPVRFRRPQQHHHADMAQHIETPFPLPLIVGNADTTTETTFDVSCPSSGQKLWSAYGASAKHAKAAAEAAQAAFPIWSQLTWTERRDHLLRVADVLDSRASELKTTALQETGTTRDWENFDVHGGIAMLRDVAGRIGSIEGRIPPTVGRCVFYFLPDTL